MTIHVNIGEAKTRLSALVAAALRGETVVLSKSGEPQVRLVPVVDDLAEKAKRASRRQSVIGLWSDAFVGYDTSIAALKADHGDPDERLRRKFGISD